MVHLFYFCLPLESLTGKAGLAIQQAMIGKLRFYSQTDRPRQVKPWLNLGLSRNSVKKLVLSACRGQRIKSLYKLPECSQRPFMSHFGKCLLATALAIGAPVLGHAEELRHETAYRVSLAGIPIARADFRTDVVDKHFTIKGEVNSSGLADLVTTISAHADISGQVGPNRLETDRYTLDYTSGHKHHVYDVVYKDGNVTSTTTTPEPKRPNNWIPVSPEDLRAVLDPISGLIFPANTNICAQTLPIYDGETRMDLKLSPKGSHPFSTDGFHGITTVCGVHFTAKGGYKKSRTDFEYLSKSNDMEIWFAKAEAMNVYAPVYVRIPTKYGTVTITAVKYGG
jgi:hypothetical protein